MYIVYYLIHLMGHTFTFNFYYSISIDKKCEYLIMGSEGVFERMSHSDIIQCISLCKDCGDSADLILKTAMRRNVLLSSNLKIIDILK